MISIIFQEQANIPFRTNITCHKSCGKTTQWESLMKEIQADRFISHEF